MWRRAYLFLVLVRLYFALSPSYLHPDENFQGPEVIAGMFCQIRLQLQQFCRSEYASVAETDHQYQRRIPSGACVAGAKSIILLIC